MGLILARAPLVFLALLIGSCGGYLAFVAGIPLPWMIGAMLATTVAAVSGLAIEMPGVLRTVMVTVLGVMLGSSFTPEVLGRMEEWIVTLSCLAVYIAIAAATGYVYFRRVCGYDPTTAYFSATPGGLSEMILVGTAMGGDGRIISLTHASRILLVVITLPLAFQWLLGYDPANRPDSGDTLAALGAWDILVLTAAAVLGYAIARMLHIPAAAVVGPMLLSAGLHLGGVTDAAPPDLLVAAAQVVVGAAIGCRFAGTELATIRRAVVGAAGSTVILLAITVVFAGLLHAATGIDIEGLVLAFAPGGLAEMSLIAIALSADAAFVGTHHIVRIFIIVVLAAPLFTLLRRVLLQSGPPATRGGSDD